MSKGIKDFAKQITIGVIVGVIVTILSTVIITKGTNWFGAASLSDDEIKKRAIATLSAYTDGINNKTFDANKYFAPSVERFYTMTNTIPSAINEYVNGPFYSEFQNPIMLFDHSTLIVKAKNSDYYEVSIVMSSDYFKTNEKKPYKNYRTGSTIKFDKEFRIKYFQQFKNQ